MDLSKVDLNLMVALDAVLAERNVTRAAQRTGMTQPGMSNALARLRKLFDDPLLVRDGRELTLTAHAEALVEPVTAALTLIRRALEDRPRFDPIRDVRSFSISGSDYNTLVLIGPLIRRLAREAPGVVVHAVPRSPDARELLQRDEVDMVLEPVELMSGAAFPKAVLLRDEWLCAVAADNTEVGDTMTMETFLRLPHVVYSIGPRRTLSLPDQYLTELGIERTVECTLESFLLAPFLLPGTSLTALIPARAAAMLDGTSNIRLLRPPIALPPVTVALWWHPRHRLDPGHGWLRSRLREVAADLAHVDLPGGSLIT